MGTFKGVNTFLLILDSVVNRKTISGRVLGEDQKISPFEALKAVTLTGAWQAREEKTKGSISEGKVADFVILSDDILKEDTSNFKDIKIVTTVKRGKVVYGAYPC